MIMMVMVMMILSVLIMIAYMTYPLMRNGTMLMGLALYQTLMGLRLRGTVTNMATFSTVNHKLLHRITGTHLIITPPIHKHLMVKSMALT
jgi:hypothetical protein